VSAKEFADVLDALPANVDNIQLNVNSPGGEVWEGIAILNQLRAHPATVTAVVDGVAASAASFIACGVDQVVMARNSQMMIHDALGICVGNAADMTAFAALLDKISGNIADVYASRSTPDADTWRTAMRAESWYNADEAVAAGLADRIADTAPEAPDNGFDLSVFQHAGRDDAPAPATTSVGDETDRIKASFDRRHAMNARRARAASPTSPHTSPSAIPPLRGVPHAHGRKPACPQSSSSASSGRRTGTP
jgi:ATP-dependent protease ClpP protease subunit